MTIRTVDSRLNMPISGNTVKDGSGTELRVVVDANGFITVAQQNLSYLTDSVKVQGNYSNVGVENFGFSQQPLFDAFTSLKTTILSSAGQQVGGGTMIDGNGTGNIGLWAKSMTYLFNGTNIDKAVNETGHSSGKGLQVFPSIGGVAQYGLGIQPSTITSFPTSSQSLTQNANYNISYIMAYNGVNMSPLQLSSDGTRELKIRMLMDGVKQYGNETRVETDGFSTNSTSSSVAQNTNALLKASISGGSFVYPIYIDNITDRNLKVTTTEQSPTISETEIKKTYLLDTAAKDMSVDGSVTPVTYKYTVPTGKEFWLYRTMFLIEAGSTAFTPAKFGNLTALANGVDFKINSTIIANATTNRDMAISLYDFDTQWKTAGAYKGRWTHTKDHGKPVKLVAADTVSVIINDDLSTLDYFAVMINGRLFDV